MIGFLIVNYNDFETTATLLDNIRDYYCIDQIVVVDNKSTDDSFKKLYDQYNDDHIGIIQNTFNNGYASGINFGAKYLLDKIGDCKIIISNSDIVIYDEQSLINLCHNFPDDAGIVGPIIKEHTGFSRGWKIPTPIDDILLNIFYIHKFLRPKLILYKDSDYEKKFTEVGAVSGCFFCIDSVALKLVDFFDENTFLYYEENIIGKKMKNEGYKIYVNSEETVFHNHSVSIDKSLNHLKKYQELKKSQYYFQDKYNHANSWQKFLLKAVARFSYLIIKCIRNA